MWIRVDFWLLVYILLGSRYSRISIRKIQTLFLSQFRDPKPLFTDLLASLLRPQILLSTTIPTVMITTIITSLYSCHHYFDNYFARPFRDSSSEFSPSHALELLLVIRCQSHLFNNLKPNAYQMRTLNPKLYTK